MLIPWQLILVGLALGLIPPRLFYGSGYRHGTLLDATTSAHLRTSGDSGSGRKRRQWWKLPFFWIDPIRGYFSAKCLAMAVLRMPTDTSEQTAAILLVTCLSTLAILVVQMEFGRQRKGSLMSPATFLFGYMAAICAGVDIMGWGVAIIGLTTTIAGRNFTAGYVVAAVTSAVMGVHYLGATNYTVGVYALIAMAPVPYAFLRKARLVIPIRG
ncbi:MAG: hypothetical protein RIQ79_1557 [Verrucomicrobiota bacterium]